MAIDTQPTELIDPVTGEIVDTADVDQLCAALERTKDMRDRLSAFSAVLSLELKNKTTGELMTRHVRGREWTATVTMPSKSFDQSRLREIANSYPQYATEYLRIERYAVNLTPYKKLLNTATDDPAFGNFKNMLTAAEREPTAPPWVKVERLTNACP